jgi:hypothetical protein
MKALTVSAFIILSPAQHVKWVLTSILRSRWSGGILILKIIGKEKL